MNSYQGISEIYKYSNIGLEISLYDHYTKTEHQILDENSYVYSYSNDINNLDLDTTEYILQPGWTEAKDDIYITGNAIIFTIDSDMNSPFLINTPSGCILQRLVQSIRDSVAMYTNEYSFIMANECQFVLPSILLAIKGRLSAPFSFSVEVEGSNPGATSFSLFVSLLKHGCDSAPMILIFSSGGSSSLSFLSVCYEVSIVSSSILYPLRLQSRRARSEG